MHRHFKAIVNVLKVTIEDAVVKMSSLTSIGCISLPVNPKIKRISKNL